MPTAEHLADLLDFKNAVMDQVPLVSTLLAVLAITVVSVLLAGSERGRLRSYLLIMLSSATVIFVFATLLDAAMLPAMRRPGTRSNVLQMSGLLSLSDVVIWAVLLGILVLFSAIGAFGFVFSRRVGWCILAVTGAGLLSFIVCCLKLNWVMGG